MIVSDPSKLKQHHDSPNARHSCRMTSRPSKRHECLFDIVICVIFGCSVCSVEYFSLRIPSGERICSALPPLVSFPARSLITCASKCVPRGTWRCNFFNYHENTHRCEIFSDSPFYNYTLAPGCACFQVGSHCKDK